MAQAMPGGSGGGGFNASQHAPQNAKAPKQTYPKSPIKEQAQFLKDILQKPEQIPAAFPMIQRLISTLLALPDDFETKARKGATLGQGPQQASQEMRELSKDIKEMHRAIQDIQKKVDNQKTPRSWAHIAAEQPATQHQETRTDASKRQFTIKITEDNERERVKAVEPAAILHAMKAGQNAACKSIQGVRKLASGDILVTADSELDKEKLQKSAEWVTVVAQSAKTAIKMNSIEVMNVKLSSWPLHTDQEKEEAIQQIMKENTTQNPGLKIGRITWQKRTYQEGKTHGSLILDIESAEIATKLVQKGLVIGYDVKTVAPYSRQWELVQCFKCQGYGHIAKFCKNANACGHCSAEHNTKDCTAKDKPKCANCNPLLRKRPTVKWKPLPNDRTPTHTNQTDIYHRRNHYYCPVQCTSQQGCDDTTPAASSKRRDPDPSNPGTMDQ